MKNIIKFSTLIFFLAVFSCSNDDEPKSNNQGFLKIGDQSVTLVQGYLENYSVVGDSYNIDFTARSSSLFTSDNEAIVYFELFSPNKDDLALGNYEFGTYSEAKAFTYTKWGQALLGKGVSPFGTGVSVSNGVNIRPLSGTFTVHEKGAFYKISFSGIGTAEYYTKGALISSEENISFSMEYQGNVKRYKNEELDKKSELNERQKIHSIIYKF